MGDRRLSTLPPAPLEGGPVLCMNIGGTVLTATDKHGAGRPRGHRAGFARFRYNRAGPVRASQHCLDWF